MSTRLDLHLVFESAHLGMQDIAELQASLMDVSPHNKRTKAVVTRPSDMVFAGFPGSADDGLEAIKRILSEGFAIAVSHGPLDQKLPCVDSTRQGVTMTISRNLGK